MNRFEIVGKLALAKDSDKRRYFEELRYKKGEKNKQGIPRKNDFIMRNLRLTMKSGENFFNVDIKGSLMGNEDTAIIKSLRKVEDGKYESFEFKYKDKDKFIEELAEFRKCVFVNGDDRHEFVNEYDLAMFVHEELLKEESKDRLYKIVGEIKYSEYTNPKTNKTGVYTNYNINRIYVVDNDTEQTAKGTIDLLITENAIDDSELEQTNSFKVSGYVTQYESKDQPNKGYFQTLDFPLNTDDENKRKMKFNMIQDLLKFDSGELAKIGFKVNLINKVEEVEFDENMLTDEEKMYIELEIMSLSDFKDKYGEGKGGYINKTEVDKISATYKTGAIPVELTINDILGDPEDKSEEVSGKDLELDLSGSLTDDDIEDMFS